MSPGASLGEALLGKRTVICCGSGGVGKTTTAAAIALAAAERGRTAVVVTIDPAKRLADALGVERLANEPTKVSGPWTGELWALMLDTKTTFDALVTRHAADEAQQQRILENRFYRNISSALSGTQEYMAMEKLYELHELHDFDLVVVDTPPTRHALDFLDAPRRLTRFLDHRLYRVLMAPTRAYLKAVNVAAQTFLRTVGRVVGTGVIDDAITFFSAFDGMEAGFRDRAAHVMSLIAAPETAFVLVTSPRADTVEEGRFFAAKLGEAQLDVQAVVVNRMTPRFDGAGDAAVTRARAATFAGTALGGLYENLADFQAAAAGEESHLAPLLAVAGATTVVRVPLRSTDVHDVAALRAIGSYLFEADR